MKKKSLLKLFLLLTLLILCPMSVWASNSATEENVYVNSERVVEYNYFKAGNTIDISGVLQKDAYLAGNMVNIDGTIEGDLFGFASIVIINGEVKGNVRMMAQQIIINGTVGKNVMVAGNTITVGPQARIGWELHAAGNLVDVEGSVGGNATLGGTKVTVNNEVYGKIFANTEGGLFELGPKASIAYGVEYTSNNDLVQSPTAVVVGEIEKISPKTTRPQVSASTLFWAKIGSIIWSLLASLLVLVVLLWLMPKTVEKIGFHIRDNFGRDFGFGLLILFATPIAFILVAVTFVGLPLAIISFVTYLVLIYLGKIFFAVTVASWGMKVFNVDKKKWNLWLMSMLGLLVVVLVCSLPFIGWVFGLITAAVGLGAVVFSLKSGK